MAQEAMMARRIGSSIIASWLVLGMQGGLAWAGAWSDGLFVESRHNFGMVPRGVKVKHAFLMFNKTAQPITIVSLRPSCGCTSGQASAWTVRPGETAVIEAEMDTRNFVGLKSTVLFATLMTASGEEAEVRLGVTAQILSDIVLNPGSI